MKIKKTSKIYISGHLGMVGSSCWKTLTKLGYSNLIGKTSKELDLRNQKEVLSFLIKSKPDIIINAAAKVGGILVNNELPYQFLMENMQIQNNLISGALNLNLSKFIFLGSTCIYPKMASQPLKEEYLLTGSLEPTNEWYALAKITGVKLCEAIRKQYNKDFISLMPTNLYGPYDNFDLRTSHVLPAMIRKLHKAKINKQKCIQLWGSGTPIREFLYVDDLANAVVFALENDLKENLYNVGTGIETTIVELSKKIKKEIGYKGEISWDLSKPNGTPKKITDSSKLNKLGWRPKINLDKGIAKTYSWFLKNQATIKEREKK